MVVPQVRPAKRPVEEAMLVLVVPGVKGWVEGGVYATRKRKKRDEEEEEGEGGRRG